MEYFFVKLYKLSSMKKYTTLLSISLLFSLQSLGQVSGNSLHFDGVNDYVTTALPSPIATISSSDFTFEVWVKPEGASFCRIFFAQSDVDNFANLSLTGLLEPIFYITSSSGNLSIQSTQALTQNQWSHLAITWNATLGEPLLYINGQLAPLAAGVFVSSTATDNTLTIGSRTDGAQLFTGEIDELSIWDRAKSECEILFDMQAKMQFGISNLLSLYSFDQGTAGAANSSETTLIDLGSASNDGTLLNFALTGTTSNWVASGANVNYFSGDSFVVDFDGNTISSGIVASQYQWIDCATNQPVAGATNASFNPEVENPLPDGTSIAYALVVSEGNCSDTSECILIDYLGLNYILDAQLSIYPNPSAGHVVVDFGNISWSKLTVIDPLGKHVSEIDFNGNTALTVDLPRENGCYFIQIDTEKGKITKRVVVNID